MALQLLFLAAGLALIIKGGDLFVAASVRIAGLLRMPRIVIGSTLVSLATTTPELVVSIMSGDRGEPGLALGNAVGSCICNLGLILGITAAMRSIDVHLRVLRIPLFTMIGSAVLVVLLTLDLTISRWEGWLLVALGLAYFVYDFRSHMRAPKPEAIKEARAIEQAEEAPVRWIHTGTGTALVFLLGAALVIFGSRLLVDSAVALALALGLPSFMIGLTVVAVGTSLPELVTAVTSARQQVSDLSVGNLLGANIANLSLIIGTASGISSVHLSRIEQAFNLTALLGIMAVLFWFAKSQGRITRREGGILLAYYGIYIGIVIFLAITKG